MHVPFDKREERILDLPIRDELKKLFVGSLDPGPLRSYFLQPSYFYAQGPPETPGDWPTLRDRILLPLWEHQSSIFALDTRSPAGECLSWTLEYSAESLRPASIDAFVFDMIYLHVWEYGGDDREAGEALAFAKSVELPRLAALEKLLENHRTCADYEISLYRGSIDLSGV